MRERMHREQPADADDDLEGLLQLAELQQRFAGATRQPVAFRSWDVETRIGKGGMGIVYLARHRDLQRQVALKILTERRGDDSACLSTRLAREAQALARVRHPNVVQIHSVDVLGARPVIEMEYVDGPTMRSWIADESPPWRQIVACYADAGEGLAAIHAAGLVHRDIKPDNLLLDADGKVKVADLGLAMARQDPLDGGGSPPPDGSALRSRVTAEGAVVGTHGYMAPEVVVTGTTTAASDQFALASSLFEALCGTLPFQGETPGEVADAMRKGQLARSTPKRRLPRWLLRVLRRGLSFERGDRYPSMAALVTALRSGLRRRIVWLGTISTIVVGSGFTGVGWTVKPPTPDPCAGVDAELGSAWEHGPRDRLRQRVESVGEPHVARAAGVLEDAIARHAAAWVDSRRRLCSAEQVEHPNIGTSETDLLGRQRSCLDDARRSLEAIVAGLDAAGGDPSRRLMDATTAVEQLPACDDRQLLVRWPLPRPDGRETAVVADLATALSLATAGQHAASEALLRDLLSRTKLEHPFRYAEALYRLGQVVAAQERSDEAFATLDEARNMAFAVGYDALVCQAVVHQAKLAANMDLDPAASARELALVSACLTRTGASSPLLLADIHEARGLLAQAAGIATEAVRWHRESLGLRREHLGAQDLEVAKSLHNLGNALHATGALDAARVQLIAALDIRERRLGPNHPEVADLLMDSGDLHRSVGEPQLAREAIERAAAIYKASLGDDAPILATAHLHLARLALDSSDLDDAGHHLALARRLQQADRGLHPAHLDRALLLQSEGVLFVRRQEFARALKAFQQATSIFLLHAPLGADAQQSMLREIEMLHGLGDHAGVTARYEEGREPLDDHILGLESSERGFFAWYIGDAYLQQGLRREALHHLRRALDAYEAAQDVQFLPSLRWEVAQLVVDDDRGGALRLARAAQADFRRRDDHQLVSEIDRWISHTAQREEDEQR